MVFKKIKANFYYYLGDLMCRLPFYWSGRLYQKYMQKYFYLSDNISVYANDSFSKEWDNEEDEYWNSY